MIDLHTHTKASDGELTSEELIDLAIDKKIKALAITDHDTVDGLDSAIEYARDKKILFIPGIELEANIENGKMHILGLFIQHKQENFAKKLENIAQARSTRNNIFIEELNKMGFEITLEELRKVSNGKTIGKPHFARIFLSKGYIKTKDEMFDKYLNNPPFSKIKKGVYGPKDIIKMIKEANGIAVLAHPNSLKLADKELKEKIKELKEYGLDGIECYHSKQTKEEIIEYKKIANELNLLITKGSDFHGPTVKPGTELDTGKNNNIVSDEENEMLDKIVSYNLKLNVCYNKLVLKNIN